MTETTTTTPSMDDVMEAMKDVVDPELGINVVDLGLVYGVTLDDDNAVAAMRSNLRVAQPRILAGLSLEDLAVALSRARLFIGNDSGAMHVAAAVGLPIVAIFGPTDPYGTAPVTPHCSIVQQKPYCSPCFLRRCPTDHRCMTTITADMVDAAARSWLSSVRVQLA